MTNPDYATLRVRPDVAGDARRLVRQLAAAADRDVTQSEAVAAAVAYALDNLGAVAALLPGAGEASSDEARDDRAGK